jgi:uncharacterized protein
VTDAPLNPNTPLARHAEEQLREALHDTRIVSIIGPRQSGKTTLARQVSGPDRPFLSLDDDAIRAFAQADPTGFVRQFDHVVIDEFQRAPQLILALKKSVDEDGRPGRFLLTGSADIFATTHSPDSLAGRIETIRLLPLSRAEMLGQAAPSFIDLAFEGNFGSFRNIAPENDLVDTVLSGGFPEALTRTSFKRRRDWFRAYVESLAQRDIPDLADLDKIGILPRLIEQAALYSGQVVNLTGIGMDLSLDSKTVDRWLTLLENVFLVHRVRTWFRNSFKRLSKTPKLQFFDSGVLAALRNIDADTILRDRTPFGPLLETFVFAELSKSIAVGEHRTSISHYRDKDQIEVDFVLERAPGQVVGIEVKASATVTMRDFAGLKRVHEAAGEGFACGIVLYDGDTLLPFGDKLYALPMSLLWN